MNKAETRRQSRTKPPDTRYYQHPVLGIILLYYMEYFTVEMPPIYGEKAGTQAHTRLRDVNDKRARYR
jgi:hypothetical protein